MQSECKWAVIAECTAKNNGKIETFERVLAVFCYPLQANDFIEKCLPKERRERFYLKHLSS